MVRWPIRVKLFIGLSLVVGMMLTLMVGSIYGLYSFHRSNRTLVDLLPELGYSQDLVQQVLRLDASQEEENLRERVEVASRALADYFRYLESNTLSGKRTIDGTQELRQAFVIDAHLTALRRELEDDPGAPFALERTGVYFGFHPGDAPPVGGTRLERMHLLNEEVARLPVALHQDVYSVLSESKSRFVFTRWVVWISAVAVLIMLVVLTSLFHRWVLHPVRLLQRGVRRVAAGSFDYKIDLRTGDEMERLADAFNDMTTRLSATYADLEGQVRERSRQLVRSERLAGVGFLAAGVAHEINNPLASIAFCSEALETRLGGLLGDRDGTHPDAKVVRNYLRMIQEEAFRCKAITEKLLDFSRCGEIQRERADLAELIEGVVEMVRHMGKYRGKRVDFLPREAVWAYVDPQEIKQVVLNLVVNALDSMEEGGTLRVDARQSEGMAEMVFADNGCGMAPDVLENIFEPFFTRRRVGKGTGLGLSITHRIVSQHGGEIAATSPGEGLGSTFAVRLPIRPAAGDAETASAPRPHGSRAA